MTRVKTVFFQAADPDIFDTAFVCLRFFFLNLVIITLNVQFVSKKPATLYCLYHLLIFSSSLLKKYIITGDQKHVPCVSFEFFI